MKTNGKDISITFVVSMQILLISLFSFLPGLLWINWHEQYGVLYDISLFLAVFPWIAVLPIPIAIITAKGKELLNEEHQKKIMALTLIVIICGVIYSIFTFYANQPFTLSWKMTWLAQLFFYLYILFSFIFLIYSNDHNKPGLLLLYLLISIGLGLFLIFVLLYNKIQNEIGPMFIGVYFIIWGFLLNTIVLIWWKSLSKDINTTKIK